MLSNTASSPLAMYWASVQMAGGAQTGKPTYSDCLLGQRVRTQDLVVLGLSLGGRGWIEPLGRTDPSPKKGSIQ